MRFHVRLRPPFDPRSIDLDVGKEVRELKNRVVEGVPDLRDPDLDLLILIEGFWFDNDKSLDWVPVFTAKREDEVIEAELLRGKRNPKRIDEIFSLISKKESQLEFLDLEGKGKKL